MINKLKLYHGSRKRFDQFLNAFHYTGNGKMHSGWGVYFGDDPSWAWTIGGPPTALDFIWVIDGRKCYSTHLNNHLFYEIDWNLPRLTNKTKHQFVGNDWKDLLLQYLESPVEKGWTRGPEAVEWLTRHERIKSLVKTKLQKAKTVSLLSPNRFYVYEVEVSPRRIFYDTKDISDQQRKLFNQQLRREKRKFSIPSPIDYAPNDSSFYDYLYRKFENRYKFDSDYINLRRTSLFLWRAGFDIMYCAPLKEYVLFDVSKVKILKVNTYGV